MATLAGLVDEVRNVVFGVARVERPKADRINGAINNAVETVTVDTESLWKRGDVAEFDDGEVVEFLADASGATAVLRGQWGSTAAAQVDNAVIRKNPWPLRVTIENKINETVDNDLWPHVWSWHTGAVTYVNGVHVYELPAFIDELVAVEQSDIDSDGRFHPIDPGHWDVERRLHTSISSTGILLRLRHPPDVDTDVHYRAKRRPDSSELAQLDAQLVPIVVWGAAAKLFAGGAGGSVQDTARWVRGDTRAKTSAYQLTMAEFGRMRDEYSRQLWSEVRQELRFVPRYRRTW